jgi:hypothetical protein
VKDASHVLQARKWNGASSITLGMHTTGQRQHTLNCWRLQNTPLPKCRTHVFV